MGRPGRAPARRDLVAARGFGDQRDEHAENAPCVRKRLPCRLRRRLRGKSGRLHLSPESTSALRTRRGGCHGQPSPTYSDATARNPAQLHRDAHRSDHGEALHLTEPALHHPAAARSAVLRGEFHLAAISKSRGWPDVITVLLRPLAENWNGQLIAVIVSGFDRDGAQALSGTCAVAGVTIAQKLETAEQPDMARCAIDGGYVDFVLPPEEIGAEIARIAQGDRQFEGAERSNLRPRSAGLRRPRQSP